MEIQYEPQIGDCIVSTQSTIVAACIRWRTTSEYSHVDMVLQENVADAKNIKIGRVKYPKVHEGTLSELMTKKFKFKILRPIIPFTQEEKNKIVDFYTGIYGKPYDARGFVGFVTLQPIQNKNYYFCSEAYLKATDPRIFVRFDTKDDQMKNFILPSDFDKSVALKPIVMFDEGKVTYYEV